MSPSTTLNLQTHHIFLKVAVLYFIPLDGTQFSPAKIFTLAVSDTSYFKAGTRLTVEVNLGPNGRPKLEDEVLDALREAHLLGEGGHQVGHVGRVRRLGRKLQRETFKTN